jgi:hypothetical protein
MDSVPPIYGRLGIPPELESLLPWWLRYRNVILINPLAICAIVVMYQGYALIAAVLLTLSLSLLVGSFWMVKAWLSRKGRWVRGTWYAEVLPSIHRLRALLVALVLVAAGGGYLVLATGIRSTPLTAATILALTLLVPAFIWLSLVQGFVGSGMGNIDFREKNPARFWLGLFTYAGGMGVFVAVVIFLVITHGT